MDNTYKNAIKYLPLLFDNQPQFDVNAEGIFEPLKMIIDFDEAYIFFLNPDSIKLEYMSNSSQKYSFDTLFSIPERVKKYLFTPENFVMDEHDELIKILNLENNKSFLTSKLIIRNTVYGFVLLCKKDEFFYKPENIDIATAAGAIISYNIKDIEISDILKFQLKALKDSIVDAKSAYQIIEQQNLKILEADKVKNEFLANISHELRTPLNAIIGFSEILSNQLFGPLNEKQTEYIKDIHVSGIHLLEMINEILDISKLEANAMTLNPSEFSISRAIDEVANIVKSIADKKNVTINKNITEDRVICADFQKIRQILYNLLSNAIKFSPENDKIGLNVFFDKDNLFIEVKDNGIGIASKNQKRIFEKFVQLENAYTKKESSTGLGLTITKELVQMHGGQINVKSELNKGALFNVRIPLNPKARTYKKKKVAIKSI